jgi:hypothetical protein
MPGVLVERAHEGWKGGEEQTRGRGVTVWQEREVVERVSMSA